MSSSDSSPSLQLIKGEGLPGLLDLLKKLHGDGGTGSAPHGMEGLKKVTPMPQAVASMLIAPAPELHPGDIVQLKKAFDCRYKPLDLGEQYIVTRVFETEVLVDEDTNEVYWVGATVGILFNIAADHSHLLEIGIDPRHVTRVGSITDN